MNAAAPSPARGRLAAGALAVALALLFSVPLWTKSEYLLALGASFGMFAVLAGGLRFIPYVGPIVGAAAPILTALAVLEGWTRPFVVIGLFVGLEVFTNLVLESVLYAGAIGVSQVALLIAVAFWSWLWGPLGLLLATPLTVCLAVMGKYVPGLDFVSTLISDAPVLTADVSYYQRLLAGDHAEASELVERHVATETADSVFDQVMLPALSYAERDRIEGRLELEEELAVVSATADLLAESFPPPAEPATVEERAVLGLAADGAPDVLALRMLSRLLGDDPLVLDVRERSILSAELLAEIKQRRFVAVCIADIPPSAPSRSRHVVRRLRALVPDLPILVGRWAPSELADESPDALVAAGATAVASTLRETREQLLHLAAPAASTPAATDARPNAA